MLRFSIICASYNYERFLASAIESILAQSWREWTLIVVDDGSSDGSRQLIAKYVAADSRIRFFTHADGGNHGLAATVRLGLQHCDGEYVAFLEADDQWMPDCLERRAAAIGQARPAILSNEVELFGDAGGIRQYGAYLRRRGRLLSRFHAPGSAVRALLRENFIPTFSSVVIRRDVLLHCSFENAYGPWLDRFLYIQAARCGDYLYLPETLTRWRIHPASYIHVSERKRWKRLKYWLDLCRYAYPERVMDSGRAYAALLLRECGQMLSTRTERLRRILNRAVVLGEIFRLLFFCRRSRRGEPGRGVLIVTPLRIGDFCMFLPSAGSLLDEFRRRGNPVTLLVSPATEELARKVLSFDELLLHPWPEYLADRSSLHRFRRMLTERRFHSAVAMVTERSFFHDDLPLLFSEAPVFHLPRASRLSERYWGWLVFLADRFFFHETLDPGDYNRHPEMGNYACLVSQIVGFPRVLRAVTLPSEEWTPPIPERRYVLLAPGGRDPCRRWGEDHYRQMMELFLSRGIAVILAGDAAERADAETLRGTFEASCYNFCGQTSLPELLNLIRNAEAVIGNDSGIANLAILLRKKLCVIVGEANDRFMVLPEEAVALGYRPPAVCRLTPPCPQAGCNYLCSRRRGVKEPYPCIADIPVDQFKALVIRELDL